MPISYEAVPNRDISGEEAQQIILDDVKHVLSHDGVLAPHIAFQSLAYKVTVELQMNNPTYPKHEILAQSRPKPNQHEAIKPFPIPQEVVIGEDGEPEESVIGIANERERKITNPNKERIKRGMPIKVIAPNKDGHLVDKEVKYEKDTLAEEDRSTEVGAVDTNVTDKKRKGWGWDK